MPTFLNSVFLAGLVAAALPILIHLFSRRRAKEVRFPSIEFLREVSRKKVRRLQLRQLLLLALRVLIVAFFALAMARPALRAGRGVLGRGSSTIAVVLDNSFSMAAADPAANAGAGATSAGAPARGAVARDASSEEGSVYQTAKKRAIEVIALMHEGDRGVLALAATPVRLPFQTPIADLSLLRQEIDRAPIEATRADLPQAIDRVAGVFTASRTLNKELYVISDFQQIDLDAWQALLGKRSGGAGAVDSTGGARQDVRGAARGGPGGVLGGAGTIPPDVKVYLIPARTLPVDNMAIERVRLDALGAGSDAGARLIVTIANYSNNEARNVVIRALEEGTGTTAVGAEALGEAYANVPAQGRGDATVLLRQMPASGALRVTFAPDALPMDNAAYFVAEQPGVRRVLIVSGASDPATDPATRYFRLALDPAGTKEFFDVQVARAEDPALGNAPPKADVIVLLDVGRLPDATIERIGKFRADGGGVFVVLGDRTDPRSYNTTIFPKLADLEVMGLQGDPARPDVFRSLRIAAAAHPIFDGFPAAAAGNITTARFLRMLDVKPGKDARVLAEFTGALPALIEDKGTIVFTSSCDGVWSDLSTSGAFLPLVHRVVQYLAALGGGAATGAGDRLVAGTAIERAVDPDQLANQDAFFIDPTGTRRPAERSEREGKVWLKSEPARIAGIYQLVRADGVRLGLFAVNLDTRESDLRVAPEGVLPGLFKPAATVLKPGTRGITREVVEGRYGRELWPMLLAIVLGLMVAESLIGRGKVLP